jgi:AMP-polyphosphate phosphotransferase
MLTETDTEYAPWTVVEAHDRRFATLKTFATVIDALERGVAAAGRKADEPPGPPAQTDPAINALKTTALDHVDLSLSLTAQEQTGFPYSSCSVRAVGSVGVSADCRH